MDQTGEGTREIRCTFAVEDALKEDPYLHECFKDLDPAHQAALKQSLVKMLKMFVEEEILIQETLY